MKNSFKKISAVFLSIIGVAFFILTIHLQSAHAAAPEYTASGGTRKLLASGQASDSSDVSGAGIGTPDSTAVILNASGTADEKDFEYKVLTDGTIEIAGYNGSDTELVIPAKIDGRQVSAVGDLAFKYGQFQSVIIPEGVKSIGKSAFSDCSSLESVVIPEGVKSIGGYAFCNCKSLKSVIIPEGVKSIEGWTFSGCKSLKSITMPDSVTSMDIWVFPRCYNLESVTLSKNLTKITKGCFTECYSLKSVTIPQKVTEIEYGAFNQCWKLSDVYYSGTMEQWTKIEINRDSISLNNSALDAVTLHCKDGIIQSSALENPASQKITLKPDKVENGSAECGVSFSLHAQSSGNGKLSYKSSNSKILSVSAAGKVTAKGIGSASITVTASKTAGYKAASRTLKLTVVPKKVKIQKGNWKNGQAVFEWSSVPQAGGYQYSFAYNPQFSGEARGSLVNRTSLTVSEVYSEKSGLYIRIRAYKKVGGKTYYGKWSDSWFLEL